jgi:hypothetical protein
VLHALLLQAMLLHALLLHAFPLPTLLHQPTWDADDT